MRPRGGSAKPRESPDPLPEEQEPIHAGGPPANPAATSRGGGKVVVLIPTFNRPEMLREAVDSVLAQTYPRVEVHVGLDGATEPARRAAFSYPERTNVIVHDFPRNRGTYGTFDELIRSTESEYVALFSDDDAMEPTYLTDCIASLAAAAGRHPYAYAHVSYWYPDHMEVKTDCSLVNLNAIVFERRALDELIRRYGSCFEPRYQHFHADLVLLRRLASMGPPAHVCKPLIRYRVHAGQQTSPGKLPLRQILEQAQLLNQLGQPYTVRELGLRLVWFAGEKTRLSAAKRKVLQRRTADSRTD